MVIDGWAARSDLVTGGSNERAIDADYRSGRLHRIRPGRYVPAAAWMAAGPDDQHRLRAAEIGAAIAGRAVISHQSAALLHRLELPPVDLPRVHITWPGSAGRRGTANIHPHRGALDDTDVVFVGGLLITSETRTLFDVARSTPPAVGISAADSALRRGTVTRADMVALLARTMKIRGHGRAARVFQFADGRAESVGESITRLRLAQLGVPDPELQVVLADASYRGAVRVDLEVIPFRTVIEFDGRVKYGRFLRTGQSAGDAVFAEKRREDAIRSTGRECVRIVWDELHHERFRSILLPRLQSAFARAGHSGWRPGVGRFRADPAG